MPAAEKVRLVTTFEDANGRDIVFSYDYAASDAEPSDIRAFVAGMITNGAIFERVPVVAKNAKLVSSTDTVISLSA